MLEILYTYLYPFGCSVVQNPCGVVETHGMFNTCRFVLQPPWTLVKVASTHQLMWWHISWGIGRRRRRGGEVDLPIHAALWKHPMHVNWCGGTFCEVLWLEEEEEEEKEDSPIPLMPSCCHCSHPLLVLSALICKCLPSLVLAAVICLCCPCSCHLSCLPTLIHLCPTLVCALFSMPPVQWRTPGGTKQEGWGRQR